MIGIGIYHGKLICCAEQETQRPLCHLCNSWSTMLTWGINDPLNAVQLCWVSEMIILKGREWYPQALRQYTHSRAYYATALPLHEIHIFQAFDKRRSIASLRRLRHWRTWACRITSKLETLTHFWNIHGVNTRSSSAVFDASRVYRSAASTLVESLADILEQRPVAKIDRLTEPLPQYHKTIEGTHESIAEW